MTKESVKPGLAKGIDIQSLHVCCISCYMYKQKKLWLSFVRIIVLTVTKCVQQVTAT